MRIAYMLTSLGIGGAERQVLALAERMSARWHDVVLVVLRPPQAREFSSDIEVVRLDMIRSPAAVPGALLRARQFLRKLNPDIVHSHTFPANMAARMLHLAGAAPRVISTIHNICEGGWQRTLAYRLTDPLSIHSTAVGEAVADRYVRIGAVPHRKCTVITNGIDTEIFAPGRYPSSRQVEADFTWLAAGRPVAAKDFANLLAAFTLVRIEAPRTQLWIAGEHDEQGAHARQTAGPDQREFNGVRRLGLCPDMAATIASTDAFVLSSVWEGMPLVLGEAMAMEKPVVATDVGGVPELVGDAGLIVPAKDPAALAEAMLTVMRMPEGDRRKLGRWARARIVQHFDMDAKADQWEELYWKFLGADEGSTRVHHCAARRW